jgi:hypothetical protein
MNFTDKEKQQIIQQMEKHYYPSQNLHPLLFKLTYEYKVPGQIIADKVGLPLSNISRWANGHKEIPQKHIPILKELVSEVFKIRLELTLKYLPKDNA